MAAIAVSVRLLYHRDHGQVSGLASYFVYWLGLKVEQKIFFQAESFRKI
jgi:hypothetical protein